MTLSLLKNKVADFQDTYATISPQVDQALQAGISPFEIDQLESIASKISICTQKTDHFLSELFEVSKEIDHVKSTTAESDPAIIDLLFQNIEELKASCEAANLTLHYLYSMLRIKKYSVELFNRQSPTCLPEETTYVVESLRQGGTLYEHEFLGAGQFGIVHRARIGELNLAKKSIRIPTEGNKEFFAPKKLEREAALLLGMNHPNIVKIAAVTLTPPALYMLEVNKNSLALCLKEPLIYVPHHLLEIFEGVACGLSYLHERMHLSHCDLHLGNILVQENDECFTGILTDFEFSSAKDASKATQGNRYIQAPETLAAHPEMRSTLLRYQGTKRSAALANQGPHAHQRELEEQRDLWELLNKNISEKNDIWAFATCLYATITCGKGPYEIDPVKERNLLKSSLKLHRHPLIQTQLKRCVSRQLAARSPLQYNHPLVIDLIQNVMMRCFQIDPDIRPSASELHDYFRKKLSAERALYELSLIEID